MGGHHRPLRRDAEEAARAAGGWAPAGAGTDAGRLRDAALARYAQLLAAAARLLAAGAAGAAGGGAAPPGAGVWERAAAVVERLRR